MSRTLSTANALAFSSLISEKGAVAHVYHNTIEDKNCSISYIDAFPFLKDPKDAAIIVRTLLNSH